MALKPIGLSNIAFFGGDGNLQSYIDPSGTFRYERDQSGAEFTYEVQLTSDRSVTVRVVAFGGERNLDELERDAREQVKRVLMKLGKIGEEMSPEPPSATTA